MGLLDCQAVYICPDGSCGGVCYRCRLRRLDLRAERLGGDLGEVLGVLRQVLPLLDRVVHSQRGGPRERILRDLVEATIEAHSVPLDPVLGVPDRSGL